MSGIQLRGHVSHGLPSIGGALEGCRNAKVTVYDLDEGGNGNDAILVTTTNASGGFEGTSSEWIDRNSSKIPVPGRFEDRPGPFGARMKVWVPGGTVDQTVPDALLLRVKIEQNGRVHEAPYVQLPVGAMPAPVVVPWGPPYVVGTVDGTEYRSGPELEAAMLAKLATNKAFVVEVHPPYNEPLFVLVGTPEELRARLAQRLGGDTGLQGLIVIDDIVVTAPLVMACAVFVVALGVATAMTLIAAAVGVAIVIAVLRNYEVEVKEKVVTTPAGPQRLFTVHFTPT